jgi:large subunit ribosomal protein L29
MKRIEELEQLREMDLEELNDQADALKESLFRLKFRKSLGAGEVVADIRREKRTLARVYTIIRERESKEVQAQ